MSKKPKILFYDIETTPLLAYVWRLGKQVVRHNQLKKGKNYMWNIICLTYCWNDSKPAKVLAWEPDRETCDTGNLTCQYLVEEFDKLVRQADITIGKNSDRFDVKHINVHRMLNNLPGMPEWATRTDDLEKQIRRYFALPSHSLDYLSSLLGLGGKDKMEFSDWVDISERRDEDSYGKALKKMIKYGKKDVIDTRTIWNYCSKHFTPKLNAATLAGEHCCANCGSKNIKKNGTRVSGKTLKQQWYCNEHGGFAGYTVLPWKSDKPKIGGM